MIRFTTNKWKNWRKRFRIWRLCPVLIQRVEIWGRKLSERKVGFMMFCTWIVFIRQKNMIYWWRRLLRNNRNLSVLSNLYWSVNRLINNEQLMTYSMLNSNMKKVWDNIEEWLKRIRNKLCSDLRQADLQSKETLKLFMSIWLKRAERSMKSMRSEDLKNSQNLRTRSQI